MKPPTMPIAIAANFSVGVHNGSTAKTASPEYAPGPVSVSAGSVAEPAQSTAISPASSTLCARTAHSVARLEIASGVGDDLSTGRVIRCLDADDLGYKG
jgi:hypothetical protein